MDFASPYLTHSLSVLMKKVPDVGQRGAVGVLAAFDIVVRSVFLEEALNGSKLMRPSRPMMRLL